MMGTDTALKLGGAAAITGGALRVVDSFTGNMFTAHTLDILYFVNDVLLMFGLVAWYAARAGKLGAAGLIGFAIAVTGVLVIRSVQVFHPKGYMLGSAMFLLGLVIMNLPALMRRDGPLTAPWLWIAAAVVAIVAYLASGPMAVVAGVLFGLGFMAAGAALWRGRA
jgi:hypothetical protein